MRTTQFAIGELYHVYNRGVDKRSLFVDEDDFWRFITSIRLLNQIELITSFHAYTNPGPNTRVLLRATHTISPPLVHIHTYCINQNHYHFILEPLVDEGVQKFMHRLGTSYTKYFNETHNRSGALFQGSYKAIHIESDEYFRHLACYVTYNDRVHPTLNTPWLAQLPHSAAKEFAYRGASTEESSLALADPTYISNVFGSIPQFHSQAAQTVKQVLQLREELKTYKRMCID